MVALMKYTLDTAEGVRSYSVSYEGRYLGYVQVRRGGWWRATRFDGAGAGSWYSTRAAAAEALRRREAC
jgi:hypothetical protein